MAAWAPSDSKVPTAGGILISKLVSCFPQKNISKCFAICTPLEAATVLGPPCSSFNQMNLRDEWSEFIPADVESLPRLGDCLAELKAPHVSHVLPKKQLATGAVLHHCFREVQSILKKNYPCIYKFGFTHSLEWRWSNDVYGYSKNVGIQGFDRMVAVYMSATPVPAAMMEAVLIKEYFGTSSELRSSKVLCLFPRGAN